MHGLRETQQAFAAALFDGAWENLDGEIVENGLSTRQRLNIYRESVLANLGDALAAVYPVVKRLVGEAFFRMTARQYARQSPSTSGDLHDFGDGLAGFLAGFPPAASLAYLPDVARLEWAYHRVFHAAEHPPLDLKRLADVAPQDYPDLGLVLHPAIRLLASDFPVHRIWQVNQPHYTGDDTVDLTIGGVRLMVFRRGVVELQPLSPGEFALLQAFDAGRTLGEANHEAVFAEPGFDLTEVLPQRVADGSLVALRR